MTRLRLVGSGPSSAPAPPLDRKAYDLVVLETGHVSSIADYFVICSGRSDTQVQAIADAVEEHLAAAAARARSRSRACRTASGC